MIDRICLNLNKLFCASSAVQSLSSCVNWFCVLCLERDAFDTLFDHAPDKLNVVKRVCGTLLLHSVKFSLKHDSLLWCVLDIKCKFLMVFFFSSQLCCWREVMMNLVMCFALNSHWSTLSTSIWTRSILKSPILTHRLTVVLCSTVDCMWLDCRCDDKSNSKHSLWQTVLWITFEQLFIFYLHIHCVQKKTCTHIFFHILMNDVWI